MAKGKNSPGVSGFLGLMRTIADQAQDRSLVLDFGEIQQDASLLCHTYPVPIPKEGYLILRHLTYPDSEQAATSVSEGHSHTVSLVRGKDQHLKPGDSVLVGWVGNDPVVLGVLSDAEELF